MLKDLVYSPELEFLMEAHNGISAKIVEESGFKGIWASGLAMSAAMGVRDNNEASWTQVLEVLEFMSDATNIPILLDGDTGYGNFNNVRRLIRKLEQRQIAGVCIEDKLFPKTNSFIGGEKQPLADINEFCGKIMAAKDGQFCDDFVVVARVEAFIAGWGLSEALRRAEAYRKAGVDAILIHSKKNDPADIIEFMTEWQNRLPVVIVPTMYYSTPTEQFKELRISTVIWANHNIRSAIGAMKNTAKRICEDQSLINIENKVVPVAEIFRLQGADELMEAEKKYLPGSSLDVNVIVLAASQGDLGELTETVPKTLLKVNGKSILQRQIEDFNNIGIKDVVVVRGFAKEKIFAPNIKTIDNDDYCKSKDLFSLFLAKEKLKGNTIITYGDIIFKSYILNDLLNDSNDITIVVDADCDPSQSPEGDIRDYVRTSEPYSKKLYSSTVSLEAISPNLKETEINGEFIGVWKVSEKGAEVISNALERLSMKGDFRQYYVSNLLSEVVKSFPIAVKFIKGSWLDIDTIIDLQKAGDVL